MTLATYTVHAPKTLGDVLRHELEPLYSRHAAVVTASDSDDVTVEIGTVLGQRLFGVPVVTAGAGNTGDGTLSAVATVAALAMVGTYSLTALDDTTMTVVDPAGRRLADATVGQSYTAGGIAFTVTAGATPFAAGDGFAVAVPKGDMVYAPLDPDSDDGTGIAVAVTTTRVRVPAGGIGSTVVLRGTSSVFGGGLVWPDAISADAKAAAIESLGAEGVKVL